MDKLRNLQNKPTPKKKNKIFIKRAKKPRIVKSQDSDAPVKVDKEPESESDPIKGNKKRVIKITNNTTNFDPSDFLKKINPSMLLFLKKKNLEPIVQDEAESKQLPVPSVVVDVALPESTEKTSDDKPPPSQPEAKKEPRPKKTKTMRDKTRKIISRRPDPEINLDDFGIESVDDFVIEGKKIKDR